MSNEKQTGAAPRATGARPREVAERIETRASELAERCVFDCGKDELLDGDSIAKRIKQALVAMGTEIIAACQSDRQADGLEKWADLCSLLGLDPWETQPEQIAAPRACQSAAPVPRCPKCKQPTASIYYMAVFGHKGKCNNVDCGYTGNWRDFFPAPAGGASLDDILKLAATADRFSPAAMIDALEQIAMICTEGPAPAGGEREAK